MINNGWTLRAVDIKDTINELKSLKWVNHRRGDINGNGRGGKNGGWRSWGPWKRKKFGVRVLRSGKRVYWYRGLKFTW